MPRDETRYDACSFYWLAGDDIKHWNKLVGQRVHHYKLGTGTIVRVARQVSIRFETCFDQRAETQTFFDSALMGWSFHWLTLPSHMTFTPLLWSSDGAEPPAGDGREAPREDRVARHYRKLKEQFDCGTVPDGLDSPLYPLLTRLATGHPLLKEQVEWLEGRGLLAVLAAHHACLYHKTQDEREAVIACKDWRRSGQPQKGIQITEGLHPADKRLRSVVLTARGAAFRGLGQLDQAEKCAKEARRLQPEAHHPWMLLAGIAASRGDAAAVTHFVAEAEARGYRGERCDEIDD